MLTIITDFIASFVTTTMVWLDFVIYQNTMIYSECVTPL